MWQEIVVILIGFIVILHLSWKIYKNITNPSKGCNSCIGCKGCEIKNIKKHHVQN